MKIRRKWCSVHQTELRGLGGAQQRMLQAVQGTGTQWDLSPKTVQVSWRKLLLSQGWQSIPLVQKHDCGPGEMQQLMSPGRLGFQTLGQVLFYQLSQWSYLEETVTTQFYRWLRLAVTDKLVERQGQVTPGVPMLE